MPTMDGPTFVARALTAVWSSSMTLMTEWLLVACGDAIDL
jgi:hypothetical protein